MAAEADATKTPEAKKRTIILSSPFYPRGGPKIVREEFERLGFQYLHPKTPFGMCYL